MLPYFLHCSTNLQNTHLLLPVCCDSARPFFASSLVVAGVPVGGDKNQTPTIVKDCLMRELIQCTKRYVYLNSLLSFWTRVLCGRRGFFQSPSDSCLSCLSGSPAAALFFPNCQDSDDGMGWDESSGRLLSLQIPPQRQEKNLTFLRFW